MSRQIDTSDPSKLSDEDKAYLAQRGELSTDVMSVQEQQALLSPDYIPLPQRANTGDVNSANLSVEQLEKMLEEARAKQDAVKPKELLKPEGEEAATADEEEDDGTIAPPYDQYTRGQLLAEIEERNADRAEEDEISPEDNKKASLISALEADDSEE